MTSQLRIIAASLLLAASLLSASANASDNNARAMNVVSQLLSEAHSAISTGGPRDLSATISPYFAFDLWGRFLIHPRRELFTVGQRRRFMRLLPGYMAHLYYAQFSKGMKLAPSVGNARRVRRDVMVGSLFPRQSSGSLPVEWRLRKQKNGTVRIIDIMVGGTSFMLLKRDEFTAIVDRDGPNGLLAYLKRNSF